MTQPWIDPTWVVAVPERLRAAARRFEIDVGDQLPSFVSVVHACSDRGGRALVLKLAPSEARPEREAAALSAWDGRGAPRLLGFAPDLGALLMERVRPGSHLPPGRDDESAPLVATTLKSLHRADPPPSVPTAATAFEEWLDRVRANAERGTAGMAMLDRAIATARTLMATAAVTALLHGDFIDKNLLLGAHGYLAVDPIPRRDGQRYGRWVRPRRRGVRTRASCSGGSRGVRRARSSRASGGVGRPPFR